MNRRGLTIYEVFLALALLLGALAILSQHVGVGTRAAVAARQQTRAAMLAQTKLAEVVAGVEPMTPVAGAPLPDAGPGWSWSLDSVPGATADLLDLTLTVAHVDSQGRTDASFALRRLARDPQTLADAAAASQAALDEAAAEREAAAASRSTGSSQSGGSGGSGRGGAGSGGTGGGGSGGGSGGPGGGFGGGNGGPTDGNDPRQQGGSR